MSMLPGVKRNHIFSWTGDATASVIESSHDKTLDWTKQGITTSQLRAHHVIAILESQPTGGDTLTEMLIKSRLLEQEKEDFGPGRARFTPEELQQIPEDKTSVTSESSRNLADFETSSSAATALLLRTEHALNLSVQNRLQHPVKDWNSSYDLLDNHPSFSSTHDFTSTEDYEYLTPDNGNTWFYSTSDGWFSVPENDLQTVYPVDRATRPATREELREKHAEFRAARKKELQSWIENRTGHAQLRTEFETQNKCRAIPSRWVDTWKLKSGVLIAKSRLCLKGFAEPIMPEEVNTSPTANRISHRLVCHTAVQRSWALASLDVSVAFLKGFSFTELATRGMSRKAVAFTPCEDVWSLLAEISPSEFSKTMSKPQDWVFVLEKAAYGLRDAPLLWHLKAVEVLKDIGYKPLLHDGCTFTLRHPVTHQLTAILTLHVDDLLLAAPMPQVNELQDKLSSVFGTLSLDLGVKGFKHFGVDLIQSKSFDHISASQEKYINDLKPIEIPTRCLKTSVCPPDKITEFRALVSAVAWVGVTSPIALTSASLLQGFLPSPTWGDIVKLNTNLEQLKSKYCPLLYNKIPEPHRLIMAGDSSFGNSGKYSQNAYVTLLCSANDEKLVGQMCVLDFKSNKSKRVATSTLHAEALAKINGLESTTYIQSYLLELCKPTLTAMQLLTPETHSELLPIVSITDCNDLHDTLIAPAQPTSSNKHLSLYLAAIREFRSTGRVQSFVWADTRDMVSNSLTKLKEDGTAELEILPILQNACWNLAHPYKWNNTWCAE